MAFNKNIERFWQYWLENLSKITKTVWIFFNSYRSQNYNHLGCVVEGV